MLMREHQVQDRQASRAEAMLWANTLAVDLAPDTLRAGSAEPENPWGGGRSEAPLA